MLRNGRNEEVMKTISKSFLQALSEMDDADVFAIEQTLNPIPLDNVRARIDSVKGQFFAVDFARKNDKKENGVVVEPAGTIRHMVCRRGVAKYVKGVQPQGYRKAEDTRNEVLTVWDVGVYQALRQEGIAQEQAGQKAYRRINMADVKAISIPPVDKANPEIEQVKREVGEQVNMPEPV